MSAIAEQPQEPAVPPKQEVYPPYVQTKEEERRWDYCVALAKRMFEGDDPANAWMAARSLYRSDIPLDDPEPE